MHSLIKKTFILSWIILVEGICVIIFQSIGNLQNLRLVFYKVNLEFMVACIISAFEYIHRNSVIHRDVKPENILFDSRGYLHLTDFGIAKIWNPSNSHDTSGTPGYMGII